jgi:two-component system sensor histidine kinase CpxA
MKGLFWRVFAWYLATTAVVLAIGIGLTMLSDPEYRFRRAVSVSQEAIRSQAQAAVAAWKHGGSGELQGMFQRSARPRFLFNSSGVQLSANKTPTHIQELVKRTLSSNVIELEILPPDTYAAVKVVAGSDSFVFARVLATEGGFRLLPLPLPLWARLALGVFTASLICFLFAHYVTSPLTRLRAATREFAGGNLRVRIGTGKPFNRGDEFTDLARDFDHMAVQTENLVLAQHRLLGDISHELRSPLARLQLALEIARRKSGPEAEKSLNRIEQEAEKLNTLIGQILNAAKAEQLKPGAKKLFDLSRLVKEVAEDADFEASGNDRRVLVENNEMSLMHGDREMLRSAIENVVRNAIRYTPGRTDVRIDLQKVDASHAQVTVRDHGPGVPADALPHLFEPFYRVNDARDRDSGGAGLGLAITRHVISAHGGTVHATNREGGGFEVCMDLPLTMPETPNRSGIKFRAV